MIERKWATKEDLKDCFPDSSFIGIISESENEYKNLAMEYKELIKMFLWNIKN